MEQVVHLEVEPQLSTIEQQKREAGVFVANKLKELQQEGKSKLEAAKMIYDEIKGNDFRKEQALAKLLEYFNLREDVDNRAIEIGTEYPALSVMLLEEQPVANDAKYSTLKSE